MKKIFALLAVALSLVAGVASAEDKAYKDGPVTSLSYIKVKPGRFDDYMKYLASDWKALNEASKKAGLITSFAVYSASARSPNEPDLILAITYANMAALDKTDEFDAVASKVIGTDAKQNKGMIDRGAMRDVLGGEIVREVILK